MAVFVNHEPFEFETIIFAAAVAATVLTGLRPNRTGIPSNDWLDRATGHRAGTDGRAVQGRQPPVLAGQAGEDLGVPPGATLLQRVRTGLAPRQRGPVGEFTVAGAGRLGIAVLPLLVPPSLLLVAQARAKEAYASADRIKPAPAF